MLPYFLSANADLIDSLQVWHLVPDVFHESNGESRVLDGVIAFSVQNIA